MQITELFSLPKEEQQSWLLKMESEEHYLPRILAERIQNGSFLERSKGNGEVWMLTDGDHLVSLCTLVDQDDTASELKPWIGYVYTPQKYRGKRHALHLIEYLVRELDRKGVPAVYISSGHQGLYEKAGFTPMKQAKTISGRDTVLFRRLLSSAEGRHEGKNS